MILRFYLNNVSRLLKKHYLCIRDIYYIYMNVKLSLFLYAYKLFRDARKSVKNNLTI